MEIFGTKFHSTGDRYWRRKRYQKLQDGAVGRNKNIRIARLGDNNNNNNNGSGGNKLVWRIKVVPKLRLRVAAAAPLKLAAKLRNRYMDMMVRLAGSVGFLNTHMVFGNRRIPKARQVRMSCTDEEFQNRIIYEMFKNISAAHELNPM
ncbi:unnamed protein product [Linum tenue]|uniref:Uncharacterized protein n=1 Tax=Linum tenue TaxID=586396 RepID=A0AAV0QTT6_9ROSI|nr:unnamed protein product [Linum tenue]